MPLYEYECDSCGRRFERIQKFSDPIVDTCPVCGGAARRQVSSPAIQFKGSGFYITDYPKKGGDRATTEGKPAKAAESSSSSDAKSTETKSTTTETKPAASSTKDKPKSSSS
jgi:putative FmdB family regulatory protein